MAGLRRILFTDFGTKTLSLVLALAVYIHVFSGQEREMTVRVPLVIAPLPAGLAISSESPGEIRVRVRAPGKELLKLRTRRFEAEIAIESPRAGTLQRPILGSDLRFPRGVKVASIEVLDPRMLNLTIERVAARTVPVAVRSRGEPFEDRALRSRPSADPALVQVVGPVSRIGSIDSVETEPVPLAVRKDTEREVVLKPPHGFQSDPARVTVRVEVEERREQRFAKVPIEFTPRLGDRLLWAHPTDAEVLLSGPESAIAKITAADVRVIGDVGRATTGPHRVSLRALIVGISPSVPVTIRCLPETASVRLQ